MRNLFKKSILQIFNIFFINIIIILYIYNKFYIRIINNFLQQCEKLNSKYFVI